MIELSASDQQAFSGAQIKRLLFERLEPGMCVAIGEEMLGHNREVAAIAVPQSKVAERGSRAGGSYRFR